MRPSIRPIVLCGGEEPRLWPVSRKEYPQQFSKFGAEKSFFQETILRLEDGDCGEPIIVTNMDYRFIVQRLLEELGLRQYSILLEPASRNTGPAVCAGLLYLQAEDPNALALIAPTDHHFSNPLQFAHSIAIGAMTARKRSIVAFGAKPTHPDTQYGYLELPTRILRYNSAQPFVRFIEKPEILAAEQMVQAGNALWNSGLYLCRIDTALESISRKAPELLEAVASAMHEAQHDLRFLRIGQSYVLAQDISFEHAVMERSTGFVVPLLTSWADVGTWSQVWDILKSGPNDLHSQGNARAIDCQNTLLHNSDDNSQLVAMGLNGVAAISTPDATLVVDMHNAQAVSKVVDVLNGAGIKQAETHPVKERPWGQYETLSNGPGYRVRQITVRPGGVTTLHSHKFRAEHWVVVQGSATVVIGKTKKVIEENRSITVRKGARHQLANFGPAPLRLVEVQTGDCIAEDDIQRFENAYERV